MVSIHDPLVSLSAPRARWFLLRVSARYIDAPVDLGVCLVSLGRVLAVGGKALALGVGSNPNQEVDINFNSRLNFNLGFKSTAPAPMSSTVWGRACRPGRRVLCSAMIPFLPPPRFGLHPDRCHSRLHPSWRSVGTPKRPDERGRFSDSAPDGDEPMLLAQSGSSLRESWKSWVRSVVVAERRSRLRPLSSTKELTAN